MKTIPRIISSKGNWVVDGDFEFKELSKPILEYYHVFSFDMLFDTLKENDERNVEFYEIMGEKLKQDFIVKLKEYTYKNDRY